MCVYVCCLYMFMFMVMFTLRYECTHAHVPYYNVFLPHAQKINLR